MRIKIWGARGSLPSPSYPAAIETGIRSLFHDFFAHGHSQGADVDTFLASLPRHRVGGYGGNTPCIEVTAGGGRLIVDGGSGIRQLGYELMAGPCGHGKGEVHLLFTHFHWDHLIGVPFFTPIFIPGNTIHVYAVQSELEDVFKTMFKKPYFPVELENLGAKIVYHRLEPRKPVRFGTIQVTPYQLDHPDPCWGFKFEADGKVYSHCVDTEAKRISRAELGPDLPLYQGVDLMTFDAQYTLMESLEKVDWGHAAASMGIDLAMREGIKRVLFMHHDPASSAEKIAAAEAQARRYYEIQLKTLRRNRLKSPDSPFDPNDGVLFEIEWSFAFDGLSIEL